MAKEYPDIDFEIFSASDLEDIFLTLEDDDIIDAISFIPSLDLESLDYSVLKEAIEHILNLEADNSLKSNLVVPDFESKISFNCLSPQVEQWLTSASYSMGDLERYFKRNSDFAKKELREKFNEFYIESKQKIGNENEDYNNLRFIYILERACYNTSKVVRDSVLILMACFFESCDIFENPEEVIR